MKTGLVDLFEKLIEVENSSDILNFRYTYKNMLIWPFIRFPVYRHFYGKELFGKYTEKPSAQPLIIKDQMKKYLFKNPYLTTHKDIMYIYGTLGNIKSETGKIHNRIFDYYVDIYLDDTYILENSGNLPYYKKRYKNLRDSSLILFLTKQELSRAKPTNQDIKMSKSLVEYLKKKLPIKENNQYWQYLFNLILFFSKEIKILEKYYLFLFKSVKPKIVFIEDASYGANCAVILKILHDLKITCAEIQHGMIYSNHEAYNYSNFLRENNEYKNYMPDYFLSYGDYWNKQIRTPSKVITLGKADFTYYTKNKKFSYNTKNEILFIASIYYNDYVKLLKDLLPLLASINFNLKMRLHPMGINEDVRFDIFKSNNNFTINSEEPLYQALSSAEYVIADISSVLFEAAAFGKKLLRFKTETSLKVLPCNLGNVFSTAEELIHHIIKDDFILYQNNFFDIGYRKNYTEFINNFCDL